MEVSDLFAAITFSFMQCNTDQYEHVVEQDFQPKFQIIEGTGGLTFHGHRHP